MEDAARSSLRTQARAYLLAFAVRDAAWIVLSATSYLGGLYGNAPTRGAWTWLDNGGIAWGWALSGAFLVFALAYGVLRHQLFDIDLKLKFALHRGTVGAVFFAVFLIVSQLVQNLTTAAFGVVAGAVAAGLLLFILRPLERMATRVVDRAMPNTHDTPGYAQFRKMEVYKATVESFLVDGRITERERVVLSRLASKLGIAATDALSLEQDARPARPVPPGGSSPPRKTV